MYEKLIEIPRNDYYTTRNLFNYQNSYKLIGINLSRQTNTNVPQQINFTGKLEEDYGGTMSFMAEKQQKINSKFFFRFINCYRII